VGVTPEAIAKMKTAIRVMPRLNSAVSTTDSGITSRGKRILRSMLSRATSEPRQLPVTSPKNWNSTSANRM
jgi:hypothetical protein